MKNIMDEWVDVLIEDPAAHTFHIAGKAPRSTVHTKGLLHQTVHLWILRHTSNGWQVLMQQRSSNKESWPNLWDMSVAGHISSGQTPVAAILREMREELGIEKSAADMKFVGSYRLQYNGEFQNQPFRDNELVYVYTCIDNDIDITTLCLQETEVQAIKWYDIATVYEDLTTSPNTQFCVNPKDVKILMETPLYI